MAQLPFLVVHGAAIAKFLVVGCGGLALGVGLWRRRRAERQLSANLVDAAGAALTTKLVAGPVALRGIVKGNAFTLTEDPTYGDAPRSKHDDGLMLELAGEQVELVGDVNVVRGTRASASRRGLPAGTPNDLAGDAKPGERRMFAVTTGDEVIVQGTLVARAKDAPDYRESAAAWILEPPAGLPSIELIATTPKLQPPRPKLAWLALVIGASMLVGYGTLRVIGSSLAEPHDHPEKRHSQSSIPTRLQLAAALPHSRAKALERIEFVLEIDLPRTAATAQLRYELAALESGCGDSADLMIRDGRYEDALAEARSCGDALHTVRALVMLGRYDEAAPLVAQLRLDAFDEAILVSVATGHWDVAAAAADRAAAQWKDDAGASDDAQINASRNHRMRCIAEWMRIKAGDPKATERLDALASSTKATSCLIAQAMTHPQADRKAALEAASHNEKRFEFGETSLASDLLWAEGAPDAYPSFYTLSQMLLGESYGDRLWLLPVAVKATDRPPIDAAMITAMQAMIDVFHGDTKAALDKLDRAATFPVTTDEYTAQTYKQIQAELRLIATEVRLHTPATDLQVTENPRALDTVVAAIALRGGNRPTSYSLHAYQCTDELTSAVENAAKSGDGGPLADLIARCDVFWMSAPVFLALAPRITTHREAFASAMALFGDDYSDASRVPFRDMFYAMMRRELVGLAGDATTAAAWQASIDRQLKMLEDPDKVLALLLWRLL